MLCMLKDKSTYLTLFQKLTAQVPGLKVHLQGYSTDSEVPLRQALAQEFERSLSFLCKIHAQRNIKEKCHKLRLSQSLTDVIVSDIFGSGGLILADTEADYQGSLEQLTPKWDALEFTETGKAPKFSSYYRAYKSEDIWHHVTAKVSRDAGFEDKAQSNNVPESGNALLKRWQDFRTSDMSTFIDDVKDLVNKQRNDVKRAFLGLESPYVVRPEYIQHVKSHSDFFNGNPGKRAFADKPIVDPVKYKEVYQYRHTPPRPLGLEKLEDLKVVSDVDMDFVTDDQVPSTNFASQTVIRNTTPVPRRLFGVEDCEDGNGNGNYGSVESNACNQSSNSTQLPSSSEKLETICQHALQGVFTGKDLQALSAKATQLIKEGSIRDGFDSQSHFVKSASSSNPHTVKKLASGMFACDKECLGYKTRKLCSHVIAVAFYENYLQEFLSMFKDGRNKRSPNLTALATFGVNAIAGRKRPVASRSRRKSPDTMTSVATLEQPSRGTIADVLASDSGGGYTAEASSDPLRMTIRRNRPAKPVVSPTTTTPFHLINMTGKIRKCAGCWKDLKTGPDEHTRNHLDERLCIRHKEHDFVWIQSLQHWKQTFENKHYHVFLNCIQGRNPTFDAKTVHLGLNHTLSVEEVQHLKDRLHC